MDPRDVDLLVKRESELTKIYQYTGRGFFLSYIAGVTVYYLFRGRTTPFFKDVVKHSMLAVGGTFAAALTTEKIASEFYYNKVLIQLSDKYNFTPEEVLDL